MGNPNRLAVRWDVDLPLFTRHMIGQWSIAISLTALVAAVLMGSIFMATGEWESLPSMLLIVTISCSSLWLLGMLVMASAYRGRCRGRYTLSDTGIRFELIDRTCHPASRIAIAGGALAGSPSTAGAGLIGATHDSTELRWSGALRANFAEREFRIALRSNWRTLMYVQCTQSNYQSVAAAISEQIAHRKSDGHARRAAALSTYLVRTALVLVSALPLFPLAAEFDISVFLPILVLFFALAMIWLVNLLGWVVIGGLAAHVALVAGGLAEQRESVLWPGTTYRLIDSLDPAAAGLLLMAGIGAAVITWVAIEALRGRWRSALLAGPGDCP